MREPIYRKAFDATALLQVHPPQLRHPHKAALFEIAYPERRAAPGTIEVTRWAAEAPRSISLPTALASEVRPDFYDYKRVDDAPSTVEWHVNFADPRLFVAYGSALFAQDEMQVAEHPLLGSVREALLAEGLAAKTSDESGPTPVLVRNVERKIEVLTDADAAAGRPRGLYGNRFGDASLDAIRRATRRIERPTNNNFIAIAAPSGGHGDYEDSEIEAIFVTAYTGFAAARHETIRSGGDATKTVIHSGFWGCGAFGGDRKLMIALQALAARAAAINRLVIHAGDAAGIDSAERGIEVAETIALRCGTEPTLDVLVGRVAMLSYRWGVSDGN